MKPLQLKMQAFGPYVQMQAVDFEKLAEKESLVGAKSRTPVGIALTILSSISFIGSLIAPLLIGAISQAFNMKYAYIVVGLLGLCILLMTTFCKAFKNN